MKHSILIFPFLFFVQIIYGQEDCVCSLDSLKFFNITESLVLEEDSIINFCGKNFFLTVSYNNSTISDSDYDFDWEINEDSTDTLSFINLTESANVKLTILKKEEPNDKVCDFSFQVNISSPISVDIEECNGCKIISGDNENGTIDTIMACAGNSSIILNPDNLIYSWEKDGSTMPTILDTNILIIDTTKIQNEDILYINAFSEDSICFSKDSFFVKLILPPKIILNITSPEKCDEQGVVDLGSSESIYGDKYGRLLYKINGNKPDRLVENTETFMINATEEYTIEMFYENFRACSSNKTIEVEPVNIVKLDLTGKTENGYCSNDSLNLVIQNFEGIKEDTRVFWRFNDKLINDFNDKYEIHILISFITSNPDVNVDSNKLYLNIRYTDSLNCENEFFDTLILNPQPNPQLIKIPESSIICTSDIVQLSVGEGYDSIKWFLNNEEIEQERDVASIELFTDMLELEVVYPYSVTVDSLGCLGTSGDTFTVRKGIEKLSNTIKESIKIDTINICEGTIDLYAYSKSLTESGKNIVNQINTSNTNYFFHQWNEAGSIKDPNADGKCTKLELSQLSNFEAPNGLIEKFGNSSTLVYSDEDGSATNASYQWFIIDDVEGFKLLENANDRTIDCLNFDCDINNNSEIIGLYVVNNTNKCGNAILFNASTFVSTNEFLNQPHFNINPAISNGQFNVTLPQNTIGGQLSFYNINGSEVHTEKVESKMTKRFNFSNYLKGIYVAVLKVDNTIIAHKKIIIQ